MYLFNPCIFTLQKYFFILFFSFKDAICFTVNGTESTTNWSAESLVFVLWKGRCGFVPALKEKMIRMLQEVQNYSGGLNRMKVAMFWP